MKRVKFGGSGHFSENPWRKWPEILHTNVSWPPSELISLWPWFVDFFWFWHYFDLVKRVKFGVSGYLLENAWREWPEILHADVSWPPSELNSSWSRFGDFSNFGTILTQSSGSNLGFPGISWRTHGENGLKYAMLLYPDHLQNWLDYGYGLVIFPILVLF